MTEIGSAVVWFVRKGCQKDWYDVESWLTPAAGWARSWPDMEAKRCVQGAACVNVSVLSRAPTTNEILQRWSTNLQRASDLTAAGKAGPVEGLVREGN